jgi:hypothetical protein
VPSLPDTSDMGELRTLTKQVLDLCEVRQALLSLLCLIYLFHLLGNPAVNFYADKGSLCVSCYSLSSRTFMPCGVLTWLHGREVEEKCCLEGQTRCHDVALW